MAKILRLRPGTDRVVRIGEAIAVDVSALEGGQVVLRVTAPAGQRVFLSTESAANDDQADPEGEGRPGPPDHEAPDDPGPPRAA